MRWRRRRHRFADPELARLAAMAAEARAIMLDGFPGPGGSVSIGGTGVAVLGGSVVTLNSSGAPRTILDDGLGNMTVATNFTTAGNCTIGTSLIVHHIATAINYTAIGADFIIEATGGAGGITITLPTTFVAGHTIIVKKVDAGAGAVTVAPASGTIDGAASIVMTQNESIFAYWNGSTWYVLAANAGTIV